MILNKKSKNDLRERIIEKLKSVPEGKRIKIEKPILEELLFDTVIINKKTNEIIKLPIWSGEFLQRIDLSEVDFSYVSWAILGTDDIREVVDSPDVDYELLAKKINEGREKRNDLLNGFEVGYNKTNAKIDLTRSFEAMQDQVKYIDIRCCNFAGVDFSDNDLSDIEDIYIILSDVSDTNLRIPKKTHIFANDSYLDGIDLSARKINASSYFAPGFDFSHCSLKNTGISITFERPKPDRPQYDPEKLKETMNYDWVGCYVNGKKILSPEEKERIAEEMLKTYENYDKDITAQVLGSIDEQIKQMKKKK